MPSDEETPPETVSSSQSRQQFQKRDSAFQKAQLSVMEKEREKRRDVDRRLKERADANKARTRKEEGDSDEGMDEEDDDHDAAKALKARMRRAMRDAEEEMVEDDEIDDNLNHLPDSLFRAAFQQSSSKPKPKLTSPSNPHPPRKRQNRKDPKDFVLGARKIRVLNNATAQPAAPLTIPSQRVSKFLNKSLALKGRTAKPKLGWERRPANLGSMRVGNGPAANFVRKES